ncbi:hypothetical protein D3C72_2192120 [compost metagenome]
MGGGYGAGHQEHRRQDGAAGRRGCLHDLLHRFLRQARKSLACGFAMAGISIDDAASGGLDHFPAI